MHSCFVLVTIIVLDYSISSILLCYYLIELFMHSIRSRNQDFNTYINSFIDLQYQPSKMFIWRIISCCLFIFIALIKDYQSYHFNFEYWFVWSPLLAALLCLLTINFQSLYLGSMSYQYRHHDTSFQLARRFAQFEYSPLINGLEHKSNDSKLAYRRSYIVLFSLPIALFALVKNKTIIWQIFSFDRTQYLALSIYIFSILLLISTALVGSLLILARKRQVELIELELFWIKSASTLRYIS